MLIISQKDVLNTPIVWKMILEFLKIGVHFGSGKLLHCFDRSHFAEDWWKRRWSTWERQAGIQIGASGLEEPVLQILAPIFFHLSNSSVNFSLSLLLPTHTHMHMHTCLCVHTHTHTHTFQSSKERCAMYQNRVLGRKERQSLLSQIRSP